MRMYVCSRGRVSEDVRRRRQRLCGLLRGVGLWWPLEDNECFSTRLVGQALVKVVLRLRGAEAEWSRSRADDPERGAPQAVFAGDVPDKTL